MASYKSPIHESSTVPPPQAILQVNLFMYTQAV